MYMKKLGFCLSRGVTRILLTLSEWSAQKSFRVGQRGPFFTIFTLLQTTHSSPLIHFYHEVNGRI